MGKSTDENTSRTNLTLSQDAVLFRNLPTRSTQTKPLQEGDLKATKKAEETKKIIKDQKSIKDQIIEGREGGNRALNMRLALMKSIGLGSGLTKKEERLHALATQKVELSNDIKSSITNENAISQAKKEISGSKTTVSKIKEAFSQHSTRLFSVSSRSTSKDTRSTSKDTRSTSKSSFLGR